MGQKDGGFMAVKELVDGVLLATTELADGEFMATKKLVGGVLLATT